MLPSVPTPTQNRLLLLDFCSPFFRQLLRLAYHHTSYTASPDHTLVWLNPWNTLREVLHPLSIIINNRSRMMQWLRRRPLKLEVQGLKLGGSTPLSHWSLRTLYLQPLEWLALEWDRRELKTIYLYIYIHYLLKKNYPFQKGVQTPRAPNMINAWWFSPVNLTWPNTMSTDSGNALELFGAAHKSRI